MTAYNKALFVYNNQAGTSTQQQKLAKTLPILSEAIKTLIVRQTDTEKELRQVCVDMASEIDLLIILGGDGTVHTCINALAPLEIRPVIGILPGGTSNDFTRTLGISQNLQAAATAIRDGEEHLIDIGRSGDHFFLNFWGIGLVADTSKNINLTQKNNLGVLSYVMSTIKTVGQAVPFSYQIKTPKDMIVEGEAVLIFVLNGRFIGSRQFPIPSLSPSDGKLDVIIVKNSNLVSFRELMSLKDSVNDDSSFQEIEHHQVETLEIMTDVEKDIDMDGEIYTKTPAQIQILPEHFRMICPNR